MCFLIPTVGKPGLEGQHKESNLRPEEEDDQILFN